MLTLHRMLVAAQLNPMLVSGLPSFNCTQSVGTSEARQVFDKLKNRDVISWNIMIGPYAEVSGEEGYYLFSK